MADFTSTDAVLNGDVLELIGTDQNDTFTLDYDFDDPSASSFLIDGGDGYDTLILQDEAFQLPGTIQGIEATVLDDGAAVILQTSLIDDLGEISVDPFSRGSLYLYELDGQSVTLDYTLGTGASLFVGTFGSADETFSIDFSASTERVSFSGSDAAETVLGGSGSDNIRGNGGNDRLHGGDGYDVLYGGSGRDILYGGGDGATDDLHGEAGADIFVIGRNEGDVRLFDFEPGVDLIALMGAPAAFDDVSDLLPYVDITISSGAYIEGAGTTIWIATISEASELSLSDFILV